MTGKHGELPSVAMLTFLNVTNGSSHPDTDNVTRRSGRPGLRRRSGAAPAPPWCSPGRHVGGEVGTVVGVHQFGGACDVLPLSRRRAT